MAAYQATEFSAPVVHYLRRNVSEADEGLGALTVGVLPAGAIVVGSGIIVGTAFNGTSPIVQIGTSGDGDGFAISAGAVGTAGAKTEADAGAGAADGARKGELVPGTELDSMGAKGAKGECAFPCGAAGGSTSITPPIAGAGAGVSRWGE